MPEEDGGRESFGGTEPLARTKAPAGRIALAAAARLLLRRCEMRIASRVGS